MNIEKLIDQQIDHYRILEHIARGGMADVYLAEDVGLKRKVALKVMLDVLAMDPQFAQRFRREAQAVAQLNHPNIVQVYSTGLTPAKRPYIAMQFVPGDSLRVKLKQLAERGKLLTTEQALNITRQLALALSAAHNAHIIHRDLKPGNVLIRPDGTPVLVDLGIAAVGGGDKLTQTGSLIGTPHYMSPEQVRGHPLDGRSDLYSLGIILYEMLAGIRPFEADESIAVLHKQVYEEPVPLRAIRLDLSPETLAIVETCLEKEPAGRFQRAEAVIQAVDHALQAEGTHGPNPQATQVLTHLHDSALISRQQVVRIPAETKRPGLFIPTWAIVTLLVLVAAVGGVFAGRLFNKDDASLPPTAVIAIATQEPAPTIESPADESTPTAAPPDTPAPETAAPTDPPTETPPPTLPPTVTAVSLQGKVVFQSNRDGDYEIFIMDSDGRNQIQLTNNTAEDNYPVVSLDGTQVLFESNRDGNWEVYAMNVDGSNQRRLTTAPGSKDRLPTWSPDGSQVAFISDRDGDYDIYIMNGDGSGLRQLTSNDIREGHVSWSVDGRLVYNAGPGGGSTWDIYTMDVNGQNQHQLTNNNISDWAPEWSPDGRFILYLSVVGDDDPAIFIMNSDGSNAHLLYNSQNYEWGADWSADGSRILFTKDEGGSSVIYIMDSNGSNVQRLAERGGYPSWASTGD